MRRLWRGNARDRGAVATLMGADLAGMAFLDPPYNLRVKNIVGRGRTKYAEFAMASGEMLRQSSSTS
jgi:hypothetical protein